MKNLEKTIQKIAEEYRKEDEYDHDDADSEIIAKLAFIAGAKAHKNSIKIKKSDGGSPDWDWAIEEKRRKSSLFFKKLI